MDYQNEKHALQPDSLEILKNFPCKVGSKQLKKALLAGTALQVFLAEDADPAITEPLAHLCLVHSVPCAWIPTMKELGQACGIEVGAAAAAAVQ